MPLARARAAGVTLLVGLLVSVAWAFDSENGEATDVGLRGIIPAEVPRDLSEDAFLELDGNWEQWSQETAKAVAQLYEDDQLDAAGQRKLIDELKGRLRVMEKALADRRYASIFEPLRKLHGRLQRRVELAEALLDTLSIDPQEARAADLAEARQQLGKTLEATEAYLAGIANGQPWIGYLRIEQVRKALADEDEAELQAVLSDLRKRLELSDSLNPVQREFLERPAFRALADATQTCLNVLDRKPIAADVAKLREKLAALVEALESYDATGRQKDAATARAIYRELDEIAPDGGERITRVLRRHYFNYNLRLLAGEDLLSRFVEQKRREKGPVRDYILGADVYGEQVTDTTLGLDLKPSRDGARFELVLRGTTQSQTAGYRSEATIYTYGYHRFVARKPIEFVDARFRTYPAMIQVDANNTTVGAETKYSGVPLIGGFARQAAYRGANKKRPESEAIAADRVSRRVLPKFNEEADSKFAKANEKLDADVLAPLKEAGVYPNTVQVRTTETNLIVTGRLMEDAELAGSQPPSIPVDSKTAVLLIHESLLNNGADRLKLAGRTLTDEEVAAEIRSFLSKVLRRDVDFPKFEKDAEADDETPKTFVFEREDPIRFHADDGRLFVVIRAGFKRENKEDIPAQEVTIPLTFRLEGEELILEAGRPKVSAVNKPESVAKQIAHAGVIRKKFEKALPGRTRSRTLNIPRGEKQIPLRIADVQAVDGWLALVLE